MTEKIEAKLSEERSEAIQMIRVEIRKCENIISGQREHSGHNDTETTNMGK